MISVFIEDVTSKLELLYLQVMLNVRNFYETNDGNFQFGQQYYRMYKIVWLFHTI